MTEPTVASDREAWKAYWSERGQPWRTEPEIATEQKAQLRATFFILYYVPRQHAQALLALPHSLPRPRGSLSLVSSLHQDRH